MDRVLKVARASGSLNPSNRSLREVPNVVHQNLDSVREGEGQNWLEGEELLKRPLAHGPKQSSFKRTHESSIPTNYPTGVNSLMVRGKTMRQDRAEKRKIKAKRARELTQARQKCEQDLFRSKEQLKLETIRLETFTKIIKAKSRAQQQEMMDYFAATAKTEEDIARSKAINSKYLAMWQKEDGFK